MKSVFRTPTLVCLFAILAVTALFVDDAWIARNIRTGSAVCFFSLAAGLLGWHLARLRTDRQLHDFVQGLIDAIPEPIYIKDARARFVWVNEAFAVERRRPARELIGLSSYDLSPSAEFSQTLQSEDSTTLAGGTVFKEQHTTYPFSGEECFRFVSKRRCFAPDGKAMIVGAHFDITRMRLAESATRQALEREIAQRHRVQTYMQRLIDVIPQPVYVKDAGSRYLMVNEAFCKHRMLSPEQLIGKSPFDLSGDRAHADFVEMEDRQVLEGAFVAKEENTKHPVSGQDIFRYICKGTCLDADGHPVIVGANFDITEWRIAELRWKQASAAKSQFLATMSHEIRTPLSAVIGMLRLAQGERGLPEESHRHIRTALENAESLLGVISDILDFSKIEAGQLQIESIDFDLPDTIRKLLLSFDAEARQKNLYCRVHLDSSAPRHVNGDPTRIRQILINLLGNALKFTETGGITLSIRAVPHASGGWQVFFEVADTGMGIAEDVIPNLFQVFQQGDISNTRRFGGTGLGLAICRQLVNAMGGNIRVHSEIGQGSRFEFDLRLAPGEAPEPQQIAPPLPLRRLSILCAEDVRVNQMIIRAQLEGMGHDIDIVENGLAAVHALASRHYDLVLMDWRMPKMDGAEATRIIRAGGLPDARVRNPAIRIVALTANASSEDRAQALAAGMDDYLTKPVRESQLQSVLETAGQMLPPPCKEEQRGGNTTEA